MEKSIKTFNQFFISIITLVIIIMSSDTYAQPQEGVSCIASVGNRNSPIEIDGTYLIAGIPGNMGAVRARATCSNGVVGQSDIGFTNPNQAIDMVLGPIVFGEMTPVPIAANLSAAESNLRTGDTSQLSLTAVAIDGSSRDVTGRSEGTVYSISNELLANISEDGLVEITAQFDTSSSARVVASATTEGSVSSTFMYHLGPKGTLTGTVYKADGITPVAGAQVSILRIQPRESAGFVFTDINGRFELSNINAGSFIVSVINPETGERAQKIAAIATEGEVVDVNITFFGLGTVNVTVLDDNDNTVIGTDVTLSVFGVYTDITTFETNEFGIVTFENVATGDFSVTTRDQSTGLLGALVDQVSAGETKNLTLRLQETGSIQGKVYDVDGVTLLSDIQVRISSSQNGVIAHQLTAEDGVFAFDTLPKSDGPFILDAFVDGRLRARVPGIIFSDGDENLVRDIVLSSVGTVSGVVKNISGLKFENARVLMQSLEGLRLTYDAYTNVDGKFVLPAVPVGDFELTATTNDGQTAIASGRINQDGEQVIVDLIIADNTLVGTVFERDGTTPVGEGVTVYLANRSLGQVYSYNAVAGAISTTTDAQGRYGFTVTQAGDYYIQAEQGDDRGRTRALLVNLNPSQPLEADVVFLAKGSVSGKVMDSNGVIQPSVPVTIFTEGSFNVERTILTDNLGMFEIDGVFVGEITVKAVNETTQQSGLKLARLDNEGQSVQVDITLSASGVIQGRILNANDSVVDEQLVLTVYSNNTIFGEFDLVDGNYNIQLVPLGDVKIIAEILSNGDKGIATTRINYSNEVKNLDVSLVGMGQVEITVVDVNNNPVEGAKITVSTTLPFSSNQELITDAEGVLAFDNVFAGDFSVSAIKDLTFGTLQGDYSGIMVADEQQQITVQMDAVAIGSISGTVYKSDDVTPQEAGWIVRMLPEPYQDAYITSTDENGQFTFDPVNAGSYTIEVYEFFDRESCPVNGRVRARTSNITLSSQGQEVITSLQFIGAGTVHGIVKDSNSNPVANTKITLTNPDPIYGLNSTCGRGTAYETTTNAQGEYFLDDIPAGNFSIIAENFDGTLRAEGNGRIRFDADDVELDLSLINNVVNMPFNFYDANGFLFDILGNGSIGSGTRNVFAATNPDNAAMKLEIVSNGISIPFINGNGTLGSLRPDGQELTLDDTTASGLFVTRRVFTPRSGYFTRYLEVLENPTQNDITVSVRVKSHYRPDNSNPRVVDTSDGDQVLSVINPSAPDRWLIIDDQSDADPFETGSIPAIGHVYDGENAAMQVSQAQYELIGQIGKLTYEWSDITIQPGERITLMHFVLGQIKRTGAREAASRLLDLPPEAIDDLTSDEKSSIINFNVPETSLIEQLPNLSAGLLAGKVLSGDGVTAVPNANVIFKSQHPLFGRIRYTNSDESGNYEFISTLDGTNKNYVIPVYGFDIYAQYQLTSAETAITSGSFPIDSTNSTQDLIFIGTGDIRGVVLRHNGAIAGEVEIELCEDISDDNLCAGLKTNRTTSNIDGSYILYANTPRDYYVFAEKDHPQKVRHGFRNILGYNSVTSTPADVSIANISLEQTGSISGFVKSSDDSPVTEAEVVLKISDGGNIRKTSSDTAGFYRFFDVPLGQFNLQANDLVSHAVGTAQASVILDTETSQDIMLENDVLLTITVKYERDELSNGAFITIQPNDGEMGFLHGTTDTNGLAQFQISEGSYDISVYHPDNSFLKTVDSIVVSSQITQASKTIFLPGAGEVFGSITRPDGTTLAGGFPFSVTQIRGTDTVGTYDPKTDDFGSYRVIGIPLGDYVITAYDEEQDRFADSVFSISQDGQEIEINLTLIDERIALPANLIDVNRFLFDVQQDGSLNTGSLAYSSGAQSLSVNNELFTGETSARLQAGRRQFQINQDETMSGLNVSRKIYVPRGAYFARYIEVFDNPTNADITVDIALNYKFAEGEYVNTSDGDIHPTTNDKWFMIDDNINLDILIHPQQMPVTANIFADDSLAIKPTNTEVSYSNLQANITEEWQQVTIPAGQRISLMHFAIQQINRTGAEFAANRLMQLPPEVLTDLTESDIATIINFEMPANGVSAIEALPLLTGSAGGQVLEAGESVPVPLTAVTVQSTHPLFSRVWGKVSDPSINCAYRGTSVSGLTSSDTSADYSLQGQLTEHDSIAIPIGVDLKIEAQIGEFCFFVHEGHPFSNVPSRTVITPAPANQNVIFDTTIITGTAIGSSDYSVVGGSVQRTTTGGGSATIATDGTFVYPGNLLGTYDLIFNTQHPDSYGSDRLRGVKKGIEILNYNVIVSDIQMQPTGSVQGTVFAADGAFVENAEITLEGDAENQIFVPCESGCVEEALNKYKLKSDVGRRIYSDSLGRFNFSAIPEGEYSISVLDPISGGVTSSTLTVVADQVSIKNLNILAVGSATVTVLDSTNNPVIDSYIYITHESDGVENTVGRTNYLGQFVVPNIQIGNYSIRASDPRSPGFRYLDRNASGNISSFGQSNDHVLNLLPAASINLTVINSDNGGNGIVSANVKINDEGGLRNIGTTDSNGQLFIPIVPVGQYDITASFIFNGGSYREESISGQILNSDDNTTINITIDLRSRQVTLPVEIVDANNNEYNISNTEEGLPKLFINNEAFDGLDLATSQLSNRQIQLDSTGTYSNIEVSRKIFVPKNGYFSRFIEELSNNTNSDITINIRSTSIINSSIIHSTSNGDDIIDNGVTPDLWLVSGRNNNYNNHGFIFSGENAQISAPVLSHTNINGVSRQVDAEWSNITVPANSRIQLLYFYVKQDTTQSAIASSERLIQLPPETITGLVIDDVSEIKNFNMPSDLISSLEWLPDLNGTIKGTVFEGDGVTPVEEAEVIIQSNNILFNNTYRYNFTNSPTLETDHEGNYSLTGTTSDGVSPITIPVGSDFTIEARHPNSNLTNVSSTNIENGASIVTHDIVFATGSIQGNVLGAYHPPENYKHMVYAITTNNYVVNQAEAEIDGSFKINGLQSGNYRLESKLERFNSTAIMGVEDTVAVTAGSSTTQDVVYEANGSVAGQVFSYNGIEQPGQRVELFEDENFIRYINTDASGGYEFGATPIGNYLIKVTDSDTDAVISTTVNILENQTTQQDFTLLGTGMVTISVRNQAGEFIGSSSINIESPHLDGREFLGFTNSSGVLLAEISEGPYTLFAKSPITGQEVSVHGMVNVPNEESSIEIVLPASATINLTVINSDVGSAVVDSPVTITDSVGFRSIGQTSQLGLITIDNVAQGPFVINASTTENGIFRQASLSGEILEADDSTIIEKTIDLKLVGTVYNIRVLNADGSPIDRQSRLTIKRPGESDFRPYTNLQGEYTYTYYESDNISISAASPYDSQVIANAFLQPNNGEVVDVDLLLSPSIIGGVVYEADGTTVVPNTYINAVYAQDFNSIKGIYTNASGEFTFDKLPVNNEIIFKVRDPINQVYTVSDSIITDTSPQTFDVTLQGYGLVYGRVSGVGDIPKPNAYVIAIYDDNSGNSYSEESRSVEANANGEYSIEHLPLGQNLLIRHSYYDDNIGDIYIEDNTILVNHSDSNEVNLLIPGAAITVQLTTADNLPINGDCEVSLTQNGGFPLNKGDGGGSYLYIGCDELISFVGLAAGEYTLNVYDNGFNQILNANYNLVEDELLEINHTLSVIKGVVTYYDSTLVQYPEICSGFSCFQAGEFGDYRILGTEIGQITVTAEDSQTSLQKTVTAELFDVETPLILDIQLPASGTINGQVQDVDGTAMPYIDVIASSSNSTVVIEEPSNDSGNYSINNVVVGDIEMSAINHTTRNITSAQTELLMEGDVKTVDLQFLSPGSISGIIYDENMVAVNDACVEMKFTRNSVAYQNLGFQMYSETDGSYSFPSVAPEPVLVTVKDDCYSPTIAGLLVTEIISNSNTIADLEFGNALTLPHKLNESGNGFNFEIKKKGSYWPINNNAISPFIGNRPFVKDIEVLVNGVEFNRQDLAQINLEGDQMTFGPTSTNNFNMTRNIFVPNSGKYSRIVENVTNTSNQEIQVEVLINGGYGRYNDDNPNTNVILEINPIDNQERYAIHSYHRTLDNGDPIAPEYNPAMTSYVFAGNNILTPINTDFENTRSNFSWSWSSTIQPGETHSFMYFVLVEVAAAGDTISITNLTNEIINGTELEMFNKLSAEDKSNIVNFEVPE